MSGYEESGPLPCDIDLDVSNLEGKTAIVTGGAKGLGQAYTLALLGAGCIVIIADLDMSAGQLMEKQHKNLHFVQCNVFDWEDQIRLFAKAVQVSPTGKIHHVVANAGIFRPDEVYTYSTEPSKPDLTSTDVNVKGTLYTTKLAMHYFIKQNGTKPSPSQEDTSLVVISSGAGIYDCLRMPEYCASKWAVRGIMHGLRRTAHFYGSRINMISPYYVQTTVLPPKAYEFIRSKGIDFATLGDAGQCLLRLVSDPTVNGRSLFVAPRKWAPRGYLDLDLEKTESTALLKEIQIEQMVSEPVEAGLFPENRVYM